MMPAKVNFKAVSVGGLSHGLMMTNNNWCVYVLKCRNNSLYIGITNNLKRRLKKHEKGTGSKFVRAWRPFELLKVIYCKDGTEARKFEYRMKRLKRDKKVEILGLGFDNIKRRFTDKTEINIDMLNTILNTGVCLNAK